mmetsp:Transcript_4354/g.14515  ORF Transcript_4354/g.14515 Transcript_4354/m.14515 type:complete len:211 (+) Transcript_4354:234-866(+)
MFSVRIALSSNTSFSESASRPIPCASTILNLTNGMTCFMTFLKSACVDSGLSFTAASMSLIGGNRSPGAFESSKLLRKMSRQVARHPTKASATNTFAALQIFATPEDPPPFCLAGAVAFATPFRTDTQVSSRYLAAATSLASGVVPIGKPAFVTVPPFCNKVPQMCSHVCGQIGASSNVLTSMYFIASSECIKPSPPHITRYPSLALCRS